MCVFNNYLWTLVVLSTGEITVDKMDIIVTLSISNLCSMFERDE